MILTITIPDAIAPTIISALAAKVADRHDIPNENSQQKAIRRLREMARQDVVDKIRLDAHAQAQASINQYSEAAHAAMDTPENYVSIEVS